MKTLIVTDCAMAEVHIYQCKKGTDYEDFIRKKGHNVSNCEWMVVPTKDFSLTIHKLK
jgi:hypothetical protein